MVAESLAQPLADERREADLAGLSGHEAAPCDWSGSQGHAGARKTRMCTAGGALVIVAYAEQLGASVATLCYAFAYLSRDLGAVCPGGLGWHVGSIAGAHFWARMPRSCATSGVGLECTVVADGAHAYA